MYLTNIPPIAQRIFPDATWNSKDKPALKWTFDDGPHPDSTPIILEILTRYDITATFFCLGENARKYPHLITDIVAAGHQLGNHGYKHLSGWNTSNADYISNVKEALPFLATNLFRPPYGRITPSQYKYIIQDLDMEVVMWNLMPGDFDQRIDADMLYKRIIRNMRDDMLIVLHDQPKLVKKLSNTLSRIFEQLSEKQLQRNF